MRGIVAIGRSARVDGMISKAGLVTLAVRSTG